MLNPSRACCCVASPCACGAGPESYLPVTGSQFIYEIAFPGSTGKVQVDRRCNDVQVVVEDVAGEIDQDNVIHGLYCTRFGGDDPSTKPCTGSSSCADGAPYFYCNTDTLTPFTASNAYIQDIGVEQETTSCGFELNNFTALLIHVTIVPYPNYCDYPIYSYCSPGNTFPCITTTSATKCRLVGGDGGGIQFGEDSNCHPWQIQGVNVQAGLSVEAPYSSAGTLRFTWAGSTALSGWVASLTSSTNGPDGNPTISTAGCSYRHRTRATNACANADATTGGCSGTTMAAGVGCGACTFTDCCCQTEIAIQFKVWQRYYTRGWTSQTTFGNLSGPTSVSNTVTAYYRGCHDQRLYSTSTSAGATRVFKLDRATMSLASLPVISAIQYRKAPNVAPENGSDCIVWSLYTEIDPTTVYSLSTVTDSTSCTCTTPGGCNALTRDAAIARGVPEEITVTRITP
jgi:hypothetical protein